MPAIIPKMKAPGVDFCGTGDCYYIVRSDIGYYMKSNTFKNGKSLNVYSLHPSCQGGDHYFGNTIHFYIIKDNDYRQVTNMHTDGNSMVYTLHPNCRGGDHYLCSFGRFYIIFQKKGIYHRTTNLTTDAFAKDFELHPNCKNGLYYWGLGCFFYFLQHDPKWGVQYYKGADLSKNVQIGTKSIHPDVVNFLPGGLAANQGPAFGRWELIKTVCNDSASDLDWSKKFSKKVGYKKDKMSKIEQHWKVSTHTQYRQGDLSTQLVKFQFSVTTEYGGTCVNTETEEWNEASEVEESICIKVEPHENIYIWQYNLGLGNEAVLFCRDLKVNNWSNPPDEKPLPLSK